MTPSHLNNILEIFNAALKAVNGRACVAAALPEYDLGAAVHVIAIGKAATAMTQGAIDALGDSIQKGLVITKYDHLDDSLRKDSRFNCIESSHPVPDQTSLDAGDMLVEYLISVPAEVQLLFLISGGASSLVEVLPDGIVLDDLRKVNDWLLGSGLDIHQINYLRKKLSCIKGGKLTTLLRNRKTLALLISDVPDDNPSAIGSGLLVPDSSVVNINEQEIPEWLQAMLGKSSSIKPDPDQENVQVEIIACISDAMQAAALKAGQLGYSAFVYDKLLLGDTIETGVFLAQEMVNSSPGIHIWGGETTIQLPDSPGTGGRNQSLALSAAIEIQGKQNLYFLAAGTDGTDGPGEDAGALVDGKSIERGEMDNFNAQDSLAAADAGTFLQASGDLIQTGPTGTNVMDLVIGLKVDVAVSQ